MAAYEVTIIDADGNETEGTAEWDDSPENLVVAIRQAKCAIKIGKGVWRSPHPDTIFDIEVRAT